MEYPFGILLAIDEQFVDLFLGETEGFFEKIAVVTLGQHRSYFVFLDHLFDLPIVGEEVIDKFHRVERIQTTGCRLVDLVRSLQIGQ